MEIRQGDIFNVKYDDNKEPRPYLIISNDIMNKNGRTVIVLFITDLISKAKLPSHVEIKGIDHNLPKDAIIIGEQIRTIDKNRLVEKISRIDDETLEKVADAHSFNTFVDANFFEKVNLSRVDFVKGERISIKEDYENEFKEFPMNLEGKKRKEKVKDTVVQYVCAFLNGGGGRIFYGIEDENGTVKGVTLLPKERDQLSLDLTNVLKDRVNPKLTTLNYRLEFHDVYTRNTETGETIPSKDEYVVEILVLPPLDPSTVYYEGSHKIWTKFNAQKGEALKNTEITDFIVRKALLKNKG